MGTTRYFSIKLKILDSIWLAWRQLFRPDANSNSKFLVLLSLNNTPYCVVNEQNTWCFL